MLSIAICDDTLQHLEAISEMVECYFSAHSGIEYEILRYSLPDILIQDLENGAHCDIAILDVLMQGCTGLATARRIKRMEKELYALDILKKKLVLNNYHI